MRFPASDGGRATESIGLFQCEARSLSDWLVEGLDLQAIEYGRKGMQELLNWVAPSADRDRFVLLPLGSWTTVLTNGPHGTDVGTLPSYAARELGCAAARAVATDGPYPATILELFDPSGPPPLRLKRYLAAANDGGKWVFESAGDPMPFEDTAAYTRPRKAERFTSEMLHRYLAALGVPEINGQAWDEAITLSS